MIQRRIRKDTVFRIDGTVVPRSFTLLLKALNKIAEVSHKKTASSFRDKDGIFCTIQKQGSRNDRILVQLNYSRGWKIPNSFEKITIDKWNTGDFCAIVTSEKESMKEVFNLCRLWKKTKPNHLVGVKVDGKPKELRQSRLSSKY